MGRRREGAPARDGALPLGWAPLAMGRCCEGDPRAGWGVAARVAPLAMGRCREGAPGAGRRLGALPDAAVAKGHPTMVSAGLRF